MKSTILRIVFAVVLVVGATTGCESMRDDYTDCLTKVSLEFRYTLNTENRDLFKDQVQSLSLLIYDSKGTLVKSSFLVRSALTPPTKSGDAGNTTSLDLKSGVYTVVAWGYERSQDYFITESHNRDNMLLELRSSVSGIIDPSPSDLFYGTTTLELQHQSSEYKIVELTKDTNDIHVVIKHKGGADASLNDFRVEMSGKNSSYRFNNSIVGSKQIYYPPSYWLLNPKSFQADFTVMRLFPGDDMMIKIFSSDGTLLYSQSLTSKIMEWPAIATQRDFDRIDQYTLVFEVESDFTGAFVGINLITINDWDLINSGVGI